MFLTVITDCRDDNARARQETRYAHLFTNTHISFIGAKNDIESAGNLIDILDSADEARGIITVNSAPRDGRAKKWENGSPFGYFWIDNKLVIGTVDGFTFSLAKKFGLFESINVTDIRSALAEGEYSAEAIERAANTQFRSFNYLPRVAKIVWGKREITGERMSASDVPDMPNVVWWVDSFGNCKTSITSKELSIEPGSMVTVSLTDGTEHEVPFVKKLRDVEDNEPALIEGSSGIGTNRFLELVVQGGSAAERFGIKKSDAIELNK